MTEHYFMEPDGYTEDYGRQALFAAPYTDGTARPFQPHLKTKQMESSEEKKKMSKEEQRAEALANMDAAKALEFLSSEEQQDEARAHITAAQQEHEIRLRVTALEHAVKYLSPVYEMQNPDEVVRTAEVFCKFLKG